ncbi:MAG: hypothetical protein ACLRZZ_25995 [Enterocloster sp.]
MPGAIEARGFTYDPVERTYRHEIKWRNRDYAVIAALVAVFGVIAYFNVGKGWFNTRFIMTCCLTDNNEGKRVMSMDKKTKLGLLGLVALFVFFILFRVFTERGQVVGRTVSLELGGAGRDSGAVGDFCV